MIYDRIVSISRPNSDAATEGVQGYSGLQARGSVTLYTNLVASIQLVRRVGKPDPQLASDEYSIGGFNIMIPASVLAKGLVTEGDVVTDDLGKQYTIMSAYWSAFGYNLMVTQLSK